ncbi:hypothetical protein KIKIMORA_02670 [Brevundimonas phage vB_BpoS-Kikimora]|uniref:Uncharacterized protein n=1 Tax=Brevundimonas phage vB_BpoS-Kikimora TaxID=2948601 RepID=A0A9E7SKD7_9CAUD|nr:hypothetical protein KIKIMORA_02670 [Brevundimonas phage vB_BpoS-Kikimora]
MDPFSKTLAIGFAVLAVIGFIAFLVHESLRVVKAIRAGQFLAFVRQVLTNARSEAIAWVFILVILFILFCGVYAVGFLAETIVAALGF